MVELANGPSGPLVGVCVLDTTGVIFGAYATQLLADLGADVIKVEFPGGRRGEGGDIMRWAGTAPAAAPDLGPIFMAVNRNKRSVLLDLRETAGAAAFRALVERCDVFASSVRYEGLERLGFGYEAVRALRPDVIYCHAAGYGSDGPYAGQPAFDDMVQAGAGLTDLLPRTDGNSAPRLLPTLLADKASGLFMGQAILAALFHRQRTGEGQFVEVPMLECVTSFNLVEHFYGQSFDPPTGPWTYDRVTTPHRKPRPTKDGHVCVLPYTATQWEQLFAQAAWSQAVMQDPRFATDTARLANIHALYALLDDVLITRTTAEWMVLLPKLGVPVMKANRMDDLMDDPHLQAVRLFERHHHPAAGDYVAVRPPVRYAATPAAIYRHPPRLGEHTAEVLAELSLGAPEPEDR